MYSNSLLLALGADRAPVISINVAALPTLVWKRLRISGLAYACGASFRTHWFNSLFSSDEPLFAILVFPYTYRGTMSTLAMLCGA